MLAAAGPGVKVQFTVSGGHSRHRQAELGMPRFDIAHWSTSIRRLSNVPIGSPCYPTESVRRNG
jgi:hypothetical protein